jgi:exonuclease SbcC
LPVGAIAILGPNGAGKSSTVNAIDVALFGPESRTLADWLSEDRPDQQLGITLEFEAGGERYRVRRTYHGRGRETSKTDLEHWIDDAQ